MELSALAGPQPLRGTSSRTSSSELTSAAKRPYAKARFMAVTVPHPAANRQPIVRLSDVHLDMASDAGMVNILRGVTLDIAVGEIAAVVGPSGAGKSSLMMVAGGLERATSGRVEVAGRDLGALDDDARARLRRDHIGIVFQGFHLIPTMTAHENVALPLEFAGRSDAFELAEAALKRVGLGHRIGHYPAQLSGGEQQRVAVARAFVSRPKLLL